MRHLAKHNSIDFFRPMKCEYYFSYFMSLCNRTLRFLRNTRQGTKSTPRNAAPKWRRPTVSRGFRASSEACARRDATRSNDAAITWWRLSETANCCPVVPCSGLAVANAVFTGSQRWSNRSPRRVSKKRGSKIRNIWVPDWKGANYCTIGNPESRFVLIEL